MEWYEFMVEYCIVLYCALLYDFNNPIGSSPSSGIYDMGPNSGIHDMGPSAGIHNMGPNSGIYKWARTRAYTIWSRTRAFTKLTRTRAERAHVRVSLLHVFWFFCLLATLPWARCSKNEDVATELALRNLKTKSWVLSSLVLSALSSRSAAPNNLCLSACSPSWRKRRSTMEDPPHSRQGHWRNNDGSFWQS